MSARTAPDPRARPASRWQRLGHFFRHELWERDLDALRPPARAWTRLLRFGVVLLDEVQRSALPLRAMGLVYTTLLSLVPFLAVTFSVLKAFGVHQQLTPMLASALEPMGDEGAQIARQVVAFVDQLKVGVLGAVGFAGLFLTVISLLAKIEEALNHVWRVRRARSLGRQFTDYLSVVLVGPVLVFSALGLTASAQSSWVLRRVMAIGPVGTLLVPVAGRLLPAVFLCVAFTFLYTFMPHTRVRVRSALVGAAIAAVLWEVAGILFTTFVAKSPSYAAIYSGFAILVLFLLWLNYAWLIVLVGAEVAYLHQHPATYLTHALRRGGHHQTRERVALQTALAVARRHLAGERPWRVPDLAAALHVPPSSVEELAEELARRGILVRTAEPAGLALARPPERVPVVEVLEAVRAPAAAGPARASLDPVLATLARRDAAVRAALEGVTLRSLAEAPAPATAAEAAAPP